MQMSFKVKHSCLEISSRDYFCVNRDIEDREASRAEESSIMDWNGHHRCDVKRLQQSATMLRPMLLLSCISRPRLLNIL
jgi:hypothetical protein